MTAADDSPVPDFSGLLRFDGQGVVVVGAGQGNGRQTAHAFAQLGARVLCVDVDADRAHDIAAEVGGIACVADAREREDVERIVGEGVAAFGHLDAVADIVGMARWSPLVDTSDEDWDWSFGMVLRHAFLFTQIAGRVMSAAGRGSLVFVSSMSGIRSAPQHGAYGAAKAGLLNMVRTAAVELAPFGVRVNAVAPGAVATPRIVEQSSGRDLRVGQLGGFARPADIAAAILFLSSGLAEHITGQTLAVDGGSLAQYPPATSSDPLGQ